MESDTASHQQKHETTASFHALHKIRKIEGPRAAESHPQ
jgi:hypothetical protein